MRLIGDNSSGAGGSTCGMRLSCLTQDRTALQFAIAGLALREGANLDGVCKSKWQSQNNRRKLKKLHCDVVCLLWSEQAKEEVVG